MPLLGMTATGEVFEENSIRNDGLGISHFPRYADEGHLAVGEENRAGIRNRKLAARTSQMQRQAVMQHNRRQFAKDKQAQNFKNRLAMQKHLKQQEYAAQVTRKNSNHFLKAKKNRNNREDFSTLLGDVTEGFGSEGELIRDYNLIGELSDNSDIREVKRFAGHLNMNERFGETSAPQVQASPRQVVVRMAIGSSAHPMMRYSHAESFYGCDALGWGIPSFIKNIGSGIKKVAKGVGKVAKGIGKVAVKGIQISAKVTGNVLSQPIKIADKVVRKIPVVGHVYKGVDKLTGGAITSAVSLATLPGDALRGEKITKERLVSDLSFAAKLGAVALTGGSTAAIIGASSNQLKKGPLGQTALGRSLLTIVEVAGFATAGYQAATKIGAQAAGQAAGQATGQITAQATTQVATQATGQVASQVAQGTLQQAIQGALVQKAQDTAQEKVLSAVASKTGAVGAFVAAAAMNDPSKLSPSYLLEAGQKKLTSLDPSKISTAQVAAFAEKKAEEKAKQEFTKQTGIPANATGYVTDIVTGQKSVMTVPSDINKEVSELQLKAAKYSPANVQANISNNAEALSVEIAKVPNLQLKPAERLANVKEIQNIEAAKILDLNKQSVAAATRATNLDMKLKNEAIKLVQIEKEAAEASLAEKPKLAAKLQVEQQKVIALNDEKKKAEAEAIKVMEETQLVKTQAAIKVAAAEEGRYWPGYETAHPMLQYGLVPRAKPKAVVVAKK